MSLQAIPVDLKAAARFVGVVHRHHAPRKAHKFSVGASAAGRIVGVGVAARPVGIRDPFAIEIARIATDGHHNACSFLYGALCRAARNLGYTRAVTYTLVTEPGTSLVAAGFTLVELVPFREWTRTGRWRAAQGGSGIDRQRWERAL